MESLKQAPRRAMLRTCARARPPMGQRVMVVKTRARAAWRGRPPLLKIFEQRVMGNRAASLGHGRRGGDLRVFSPLRAAVLLCSGA